MGKRHDRSGAEPAAATTIRLLRRLFLRLLIIYGNALGINYVWEMLQMPFYEGMYFSDPESYLRCLIASFGDANIVIAIFGLGSLLFRTWRWPFNLSATKFAYLLASGASTAVLIEWFALRTGRWRYSILMPLLPVLEVGLIPILQLIILPYLSYRLAGIIPYFRTGTKHDC